MWRILGAAAEGKWPLAGDPPAEWFEAMGRIEERLDAYAQGRGLEGVPSPDAVLRQQLAGMVTCQAHLRVLLADAPGAAEERAAGRDLATLARIALKRGVVPLLIPPAPDPLPMLLAILLPGVAEGRRAVVGAPGGYRLERADLVLLKERAVAVTAKFRDEQGRKVDVGLCELRESVTRAIEIACGPRAPVSGWNEPRTEPSGLLYEVIAELQPWLLGLEHLTPNALRQRLQRGRRAR